MNSDSECALLVRLSTAIAYNESLNQKVTEGDSVIMHCGPKVNPGDSYIWIKDFNYFGGPHLSMNPPLQVCMTTFQLLVGSIVNTVALMLLICVCRLYGMYFG